MPDMRRTMKKKPAGAGWALLAMLLGMAPASAVAKDICVREVPFGLTYVFSKVKTLRPGRAVPLTGARILAIGSNVVPVDGTAVMRTDGRINIGVLVHNMSPSLSQPTSSFLVSMETDADFTGTGTVNGDGEFRADGGSVTWTSVDCASVTIP